MLSGSRIQERLAALGSTEVVHCFETVGSTNDEARAAAARGESDGAAFAADAQTAGRGRGANSWHSPRGTNLYLSVLLRPEATPPAMSALALAVGIGVAGVVDAHLLRPRAMIKWPNDIYVDDRKLAGILVEATVQGARPPVIVVGVGLNVHTERFPDDLARSATSLALAGGDELDREIIAAELIAAVRSTARRFVREGLATFLPPLRERDYLRGKRVAVGEARGTVTGIDDAGRLLVGDEPVASGAVSLLREDLT